MTVTMTTMITMMMSIDDNVVITSMLLNMTVAITILTTMTMSMKILTVVYTRECDLIKYFFHLSLALERELNVLDNLNE